MGLIRAAGNLCYVECDIRNCTKKIEHIDERVLHKLAGWSGWESRGNQWICPECVKKERVLEAVRKINRI
jgi:hypothetical protein